jgi:hypothetical protein
MIQITYSFMSIPILILVMSLDCWLFIASLRLVLGRLSATRNGRLCLSLAELTDPIVRPVDRVLGCWHCGSVVVQLSWLAVFSFMLITRHVLIQLAVWLSH